MGRFSFLLVIVMMVVHQIPFYFYRSLSLFYLFFFNSQILYRIAMGNISEFLLDNKML